MLFGKKKYLKRFIHIFSIKILTAKVTVSGKCDSEYIREYEHVVIDCLFWGRCAVIGCVVVPTTLLNVFMYLVFTKNLCWFGADICDSLKRTKNQTWQLTNDNNNISFNNKKTKRNDFTRFMLGSHITIYTWHVF